MTMALCMALLPTILALPMEDGCPPMRAPFSCDGPNEMLCPDGKDENGCPRPDICINLNKFITKCPEPMDA